MASNETKVAMGLGTVIVGLMLAVAGLFTLLWLDVFTIKLFFNSIGVAI